MYRSLDDLITLARAFDQIKRKLETKMPFNSTFPTKKSVNLMGFPTTAIIEENYIVTLLLEIPIVYDSTVEELFFVPLPHEGHVPLTKPGSLLVDRTKRLYLQDRPFKTNSDHAKYRSGRRSYLVETGRQGTRLRSE